jgi:hypothetical protein
MISKTFTAKIEGIDVYLGALGATKCRTFCRHACLFDISFAHIFESAKSGDFCFSKVKNNNKNRTKL